MMRHWHLNMQGDICILWWDVWSRLHWRKHTVGPCVRPEKRLSRWKLKESLLFCKSAVRLQSDLWKIRFPELGVRGAAIATVIARIAEVAVVMAWAHSHTAEKPFMRGVYRSFHVPMDLVKGGYQRNPAAVKRDFMGRRNGNAGTLFLFFKRDWLWLQVSISQRHYQYVQYCLYRNGKCDQESF